MKKYIVHYWGELPTYISGLISKFNGQEANIETFIELDREIEFIVMDLKMAHGNTCRGDLTGWLCPKNNDNSWNMRIEIA